MIRQKKKLTRIELMEIVINLQFDVKELRRGFENIKLENIKLNKLNKSLKERK